MFSLRVPTGEFVLAALRAGKEAGFEGAILLLARMLEAGQETELRNKWSDLDDITHQDVLVLTTGTVTESANKAILAYGIQRAVCADGVSVLHPNMGNFNNNFEALLNFAKPLPDLAVGGAAAKRLLNAHGLTDIRRTLGIEESELPALLIVGYRQQIEYLIRLDANGRQVSPVTVITQIAKNLDDVPYRHRTLLGDFEKLDHELDEMYGSFPHIPSTLEKDLANVQAESRRINAELSWRRSKVEGTIIRIRKAVISAPDELKIMGEELIHYIEGEERDSSDVNRWLLAIRDFVVSRIDASMGGSANYVGRVVHNRRELHKKVCQLLEVQSNIQARYNRLCDAIAPTKQWEHKKGKIVRRRQQIREELLSVKSRLPTVFQEAVIKTMGVLQLIKESETKSIQLGAALLTKDGRRLRYAPRSTMHPLSGREAMNLSPLFHVFLSHNSSDKSAVRQLNDALKGRGLKIWFDEEQLIPGRPWQEALEEVIQNSQSAAILIGRDGIRPWEDREMRSCLSEFVARGMPVIPVLLPGAPEKPLLPSFLKEFTWVDFRNGITSESIDFLEWGVTGKKPVR